jgi:methionine-rich copper-binding protein CopC
MPEHRTRARATPPFWAPAALCGALAAALGMLPDPAAGHAIVVLARPAMNALVHPGTLEIRLEFNSRIDRDRSRLSLRRPDATAATIARLPSGRDNVLAGRADATMIGRWKLDWQVLSLDGHITRGEVSFSVDEKAPPP